MAAAMSRLSRRWWTVDHSAKSRLVVITTLVCSYSLAHRKFKRPLKPDDQTEASQEGPTAAVRSWRIVAAAPIRTVSPLPLGLVWP